MARQKQAPKSHPFMVRQGDVLVVRVNDLPANLTARKRDAGRVVLAYGEVTGHAHAIIEKAVIHYDAPNAADAARQLLADVGLSRMVVEEASFLDVQEDARLVHDEHTVHVLPKGRYVALRQCEWSDAAEPIQVAD